MIIVMKQDAKVNEVERVESTLVKMGYAHVTEG